MMGDKMPGKADQVAGKLKEAAGKASGDNGLQEEGKRARQRAICGRQPRR
jgi:uncharacterized protein YjbJ (UPF0337 family)